MYKDKFQAAGAKVPRICMPASQVDLYKWAVIACDQFTSEPHYWEDVEQIVRDAPSALHITLPELYLESPDVQQRIDRINHTMQAYLDQGIVKELEEALHLVRRKPEHSPERWGLVICLDLEAYDYREGSESMIRATEGTILERIPPRLRIREHACLELPHIMVLIDDPSKLVIEPMIEQKDQCEILYDFTLMKDGGEITGYKVTDPDLLDKAANGLNLLAGNDSGMLYAVGDGNHSLATAKASWEQIKSAASSDEDIMDHPARWALVEIENIHDPGLIFEPIHRVLFNVTKHAMEAHFSKVCGSWRFFSCSSLEEVKQAVTRGAEDGHVAGFVDEHTLGYYLFSDPKSTIPAGTLQEALDSYLEAEDEASVDYIHGDASTCTLAAKPGNCGFLLPAIEKHTFFYTVQRDGALPRKTFSMGEAEEKRYYLEARKIIR